MSIEEKLKEVLQDVIDLKPDDIQPDAKLDEAYGVDSTEMVEITVALKKSLGLDSMQNSDLKKKSKL